MRFIAKMTLVKQQPSLSGKSSHLAVGAKTPQNILHFLMNRQSPLLLVGLNIYIAEKFTRLCGKGAEIV